MKQYYLTYPNPFNQRRRRRLSDQHYQFLETVRDERARRFYEIQAELGDWDLGTLVRNIRQNLYDTMSADTIPEDPQDVIKTEYNFEFLNESPSGQSSEGEDETAPAARGEAAQFDFADAAVAGIERFLLEMGRGFAFVERIRRVVIGSTLHSIPLVLFHRGLRRLVLIDILDRRFDPADVGRMNLWRTYVARTDSVHGENAPIGLLICSDPDETTAHYALGDLEDKIFVARMMLELPAERRVAEAARRAVRDISAARNDPRRGN